jgi:hypothetical protein
VVQVHLVFFVFWPTSEGEEGIHCSIGDTREDTREDTGQIVQKLDLHNKRNKAMCQPLRHPSPLTARAPSSHSRRVLLVLCIVFSEVSQLCKALSAVLASGPWNHFLFAFFCQAQTVHTDRERGYLDEFFITLSFFLRFLSRPTSISAQPA